MGYQITNLIDQILIQRYRNIYYIDTLGTVNIHICNAIHYAESSLFTT